MSKKAIKLEGDVLLTGFEIIYSDGVFYNKDKTNTAVVVQLMVNGKVFEHRAHMWQFEVAEYLAKFGAEI